MRRSAESGLALLCALVGSACVFDSSGILFTEDSGRPDAATDARPDADTADASRVDASPPATTLDIGDVRLVYGELLPEYLTSQRWSRSDGDWSQEQPTPSLGGQTRWVLNKVSPDGRGEEVIAAMTEAVVGMTLRLLRWSGSAWVVDWRIDSDVIEGETRCFDLEYESSGDLLVVYATGGTTPVYRTRTDGVWSLATPLPLNDALGPYPDTNDGNVLWVELERRPGTDEIALAYADDADDLVAIVWTGTQWDVTSARTLETDLKHNPLIGLVYNRVYDLAYESLSGALMVAWGNNWVGDFYYAMREPGSGVWSPTAEYVPAILAGQVHFLDLAGDPTTDRIAGGFYDLGDGTERLGLATWDGDAWQDGGEYDSQTRDVNDSATGDAPGAVGWIGASGIAVAIYADDQEGTLDWARWSQLDGWVIQDDESFPTKGYTESVWLEPTPTGEQLVLVLSDDDLQLFAAVYDGVDWTLSNLGTALATSLVSDMSASFSIDARDQ